jgi:hypothetical protein
MNQRLIPWLLLSILPACSSEEPGPKADDTLKTVGVFCEAWAEAVCNDDAVQSCDSDLDTCLSRQASYCLNLIPVGYNPANSEICIRAVERAYAVDPGEGNVALNTDELRLVQRLEGECGQLVNGGRVEGEECTLSTQCDTVSGYVCVIKAGAATGTCQIPEYVTGGSDCADPEIVCSDDLYCDTGTTRSLCAFPADLGDPCTNNAMCGLAGVCEIPTDETEGECVPRLPNGEECSQDDQCESNFCLRTAAPPRCASNVVLTGESSVCASL